MSEPKSGVAGWDLLLTRLVLGGLFVFAGVMKAQDVQSFAEAVDAFRIVPAAWAPWLAFLIPWVEMVSGAILILGLMSRASALVIFVMLLGFIGGMLSVMIRDVDVDCSCFGDYFGDSKVGWPTVVRNLVFLGLAAPLVVRGGGLFAIDEYVAMRRRMASAASGDSSGS